MFKPKSMTRALVVGPASIIEDTIKCLHSLNAAHLIESEVSFDIFRHGRALPHAGRTAENLVRVRSILSALGFGEERGRAESIPETELASSLDAKIDEIEKQILERHENLKKTDAELVGLRARLAELEPFADLGINFELLHGYESLACFVGKSRERLGNRIDEVTTDYLFVHGPTDRGLFALFVPADKREETDKLLHEAGFNAERQSEEKGDPIALVGECKENISRRVTKLGTLSTEIDEAKAKYSTFLFAAEEYLNIQLQKAEAPLRFTCTDRSFVIDFWVPTDSFSVVNDKLQKGTDGALHITELETKTEHGHHDEEEAKEPPTAYDNPRGVRGFETLINMFTTPKHDEIDPTPVITFGFPIMFGFMIGDLAYGLIFMLIGLILAWKKNLDAGIRTMGWYMIVGGFWAAIFGGVMFADVFGIPFHSAHPDSAKTWNSWEQILGTTGLWGGYYHKTNGDHIKSMLTLTILFGCVYMLFGFFLGFLNEIAHGVRGVKHALVKIGFFLVLLGFGVLVITFDATVIGFSDLAKSIAEGVPLLGKMDTVLALLIPGVILILAGNPMEILEFVGPFANMVSFARLAAIGVAKGYLVGAFNDLGIPMLGKGTGWLVLGVFILVAAHLMVLVLGFLSAFIQGLRLNYYEMFMKFVKGGGTSYTPFGWKPKFVRMDSK
ncbi:MAG: V-type ATP synthase subunit I [Planctomycetota bacterium]|jgi:V/A-type H+-transporting ATPase subunit I